MSDQKPHNPSAYPQSGEMHHSKRGMTLRDHFAGLAMQAFISTYGKETTVQEIGDGSEGISQMAYKLADGMLYERSDD